MDFKNNGPVPTVRKFSRYLVILGVVAATVFMVFAAFSVIAGDRDGGSRVVSTAGGLVLLLMAFTIWKVVEVESSTQRPGKHSADDNRPVNPYSENPSAEIAQEHRPNMGNVTVPLTRLPLPPIPTNGRLSPARTFDTNPAVPLYGKDDPPPGQ